METMIDYTIYCTEQQTRLAHKLGAPLEIFDPDNSNGVICENGKIYAIPTTQQMIGWILTSKRIKDIYVYQELFEAKYKPVIYIWINKDEFTELKVAVTCFSRKEAKLAAIDAALNFLEKGGKV